jgi:hypothetical protein
MTLIRQMGFGFNTFVRTAGIKMEECKTGTPGNHAGGWGES